MAQVGKGANMKLAVNMVMGTMMTSLAEGITLAEKAGLDTRQFVEVTGLGAIAAPMFGLKVWCLPLLHISTPGFRNPISSRACHHIPAGITTDSSIDM